MFFQTAGHTLASFLHDLGLCASWPTHVFFAAIAVAVLPIIFARDMRMLARIGYAGIFVGAVIVFIPILGGFVPLGGEGGAGNAAAAATAAGNTTAAAAAAASAAAAAAAAAASAARIPSALHPDPRITMFGPADKAGSLVVAGLCMVGWSAHSILPSIYVSLRNPTRDYPRAVKGSFFIALCIWICLGVVGYLTFGPDAKSIVLLNLPSGVVTRITWAVFICFICAKFPLVMYPITSDVDRALRSLCLNTGGDGGDGGDGGAGSSSGSNTVKRTDYGTTSSSFSSSSQRPMASSSIFDDDLQLLEAGLLLHVGASPGTASSSALATSLQNDLPLGYAVIDDDGMVCGDGRSAPSGTALTAPLRPLPAPVMEVRSPLLTPVIGGSRRGGNRANASSAPLVSSNTSPPPPDSRTSSWYAFHAASAAARVGILLAAFGVACLVPSFDFFCAILGAIVSTSIVGILPIAVSLKLGLIHGTGVGDGADGQGREGGGPAAAASVCCRRATRAARVVALVGCLALGVAVLAYDLGHPPQ
jgi:amino acid permease